MRPWAPGRRGVVAGTLALLAVLPATLPHPLTRLRVALYGPFLAVERQRAVLGLRGLPFLDSPHFRIVYTPGARREAEMVRAAAEAAYGPVVARMGARPDGRALVVVEPDAASLRRAFGWGAGEWAAGVYWGGVIRVLAPSAWVPGATEEERQRAFERLNPLAHEFTHYMLDRIARGNYPRWFSEGLAQRYEYQVTGYRWIVPGASDLDQPLYSLDDLERRFDELPNQPLAYREAHLLVDYLAGRCGEEGLRRLVRRLGDGAPFGAAVESVCGVSRGDLEALLARPPRERGGMPG